MFVSRQTLRILLGSVLVAKSALSPFLTTHHKSGFATNPNHDAVFISFLRAEQADQRCEQTAVAEQ